MAWSRERGVDRYPLTDERQTVNGIRGMAYRPGEGQVTAFSHVGAGRALPADDRTPVEGEQ